MALLITSCAPTNEEQAAKLVSDCIKDYLTYPDSYESISTKIDSTRVNVSKIEEILEQTKEVASLNSKIRSLEFDVESAQSTMEIYAPDGYYYSDFERGKYNRAKAEYEKHKTNLQQSTAKLQSKVQDLRVAAENLYDAENNGWIVTHRYRSKGDNGEQLPPQEMVFFCDLEFNHCQGWMSQQYEFISKIINFIVESESDEELLDNLSGVRYLL
jgi:predicted nuclease with TOPRIM domain